jgi:hypothetical protein
MISRLVIAPLRALVVLAAFPTHSALGAQLAFPHAPLAQVTTAHGSAQAALPPISTRPSAPALPHQGA